jgi:hypothetical protein
MVSIGGAGKGKLFSYDVDVSKAFHAKPGEAIITIAEPSTAEYLAMQKAVEAKNPKEALEIVLGLVRGTNIQTSDDNPEPAGMELLKATLRDNGTLYLYLFQEWQKMLPLDSPKG